MRYLAPLALVGAVVSARVLDTRQQDVLNGNQQDINGYEANVKYDQFLVELSPGNVRWIREEEKWEMKRKGQKFMDISENKHLYPYVELTERAVVNFPPKTSYNTTVKPLAKHLKEENMRAHLETFSSFYTRYYQSSYGIDSAKWLYGQIKDIIATAGADKYGATVEKFDHPWGQFSIIARFPGKSNKTVVIGAHQDSINMFLPSLLSAPGADDDGSGTVTILEALRVLLKSDDIVQNKAENTIEFHWYSAEEGGLLGSQAIFSSYAKNGRNIKAMLQQDMTGYIHETLAAGEPESVGVITDYTDPGLTNFIKEVITTYCDIPYVETKCGYACSDHASASKYGYPAAFVIESDFKYSDHKIHTSDDLIEYLSFSHMLQHAKMTLGLAYELAMASL